MMTAWYFATALAFNYDEVVPYLETQHLDDWTHNKAIQKAVGKPPDYTGTKSIFKIVTYSG